MPPKNNKNNNNRNYNYNRYNNSNNINMQKFTKQITGAVTRATKANQGNQAVSQMQNQIKQLQMWTKAFIRQNQRQPLSGDVTQAWLAGDRQLQSINEYVPGAGAENGFEKEAIKKLTEDIYVQAYGALPAGGLTKEQRQEFVKVFIADDYESRQARRDRNADRRASRRQTGGGLTNVISGLTDSAVRIVDGASNAAKSIVPLMLTQSSGDMGQQIDTSSVPRNMSLYQNNYDKYSCQSVNLDCLQSVLAPSTMRARQPSEYNTPTAIAASKSVYPVISNSHGDCGLYIFSGQPIIADPSAYMAGCFLAGLSDSTFEPATGAQTPAPSQTVGPLSSAASYMLQYKCTAFSVSFIPTQSALNNSGEMYYAYFPKAVNNSSEDSNVIVIPLSQLTNTPYYDRSSLVNWDEKRMIKIPQFTDEVQLVTSSTLPVAPPFENFFYFLFSGCAVSATIGELQVTYQYEYDPTLASMPLTQLEQPQPGRQTVSCINNIIREFPFVQKMSSKAALDLVCKIRSILPCSHADHDDVIQIARQACASVAS